MTLLAAFAAAFLFVALRAFQQKNVQGDHYVLVIPVSIAMAASEAVVIVNIARAGWDLGLVLAVGVGSGLGCVTAMLIHNRYVKRGN